MAADAPAVPAPTAPALLAEAARYPWWAEKWAAIDLDSRAAYDHWVDSATGSRSLRRARQVSRRIWCGRPWAGLARRRLQAAWDLVGNDPSSATADAALGPAGWLP